jgi:hypothetical protein
MHEPHALSLLVLGVAAMLFARAADPGDAGLAIGRSVGALLGPFSWHAVAVAAVCTEEPIDRPCP